MSKEQYPDREKEALTYLKTNWTAMQRAITRNFELSDEIVKGAKTMAEGSVEFMSVIVMIDQIKKRFHQMLRRQAANYDIDLRMNERSARSNPEVQEKVKRIVGD